VAQGGGGGGMARGRAAPMAPRVAVERLQWLRARSHCAHDGSAPPALPCCLPPALPPAPLLLPVPAPVPATLRHPGCHPARARTSPSLPRSGDSPPAVKTCHKTATRAQGQRRRGAAGAQRGASFESFRGTLMHDACRRGIGLFCGISIHDICPFGSGGGGASSASASRASGTTRPARSAWSSMCPTTCTHPTGQTRWSNPAQPGSTRLWDQNIPPGGAGAHRADLDRLSVGLPHGDRLRRCRPSWRV